MTAFDCLKDLNNMCRGFFSTEKPKERVSNGELKRWFDKGVVVINGLRPKAFDTIGQVETIVLFPKNNKQRRTFVFE